MLRTALVAALCAIPILAAAQQGAPRGAPQSAMSSDEQSCKALGGSNQWVADRCFTGKSCPLKNKLQGWEAYKDGQKGCSRTSPELVRLLHEDLQDPEKLKKWCTTNGGFFSFDRCFTGESCPYTGGKTGSVAISEGKVGCSEFGPRPKGQPKLRPRRSADWSV